MHHFLWKYLFEIRYLCVFCCCFWFVICYFGVQQIFPICANLFLVFIIHIVCSRHMSMFSSFSIRINVLRTPFYIHQTQKFEWKETGRSGEGEKGKKKEKKMKEGKVFGWSCDTICFVSIIGSIAKNKSPQTISYLVSFCSSVPFFQHFHLLCLVFLLHSIYWTGRHQFLLLLLFFSPVNVRVKSHLNDTWSSIIAVFRYSNVKSWSFA